MLNRLRVLDLTDEKGILCGRILGDLGADVIKVERPGGDLTRRIGPFFKDVPDPNKSLFWFFYNLNKRSITLDIESSDGREIFRRLVRNSDFVIESFPPGYLGSLGLDYSQLSSINPRIIVTSITPFGQTGPYKDFRTSDIVAMAMAGVLYITGDPDRVPVRISFPQAYLHAAADAAAATMVAHYHREKTGEGQHVDVSIQHSVVLLLAHAIPLLALNGIELQRGGLRGRSLWKCQDGFVMFTLHGGAIGAKSSRPLVEWMEREGVADDWLRTINWSTFDRSTASRDTIDRIEKAIYRFFERHTKEALYEGAVARGIMLYPVCTAEDIADYPQLKARQFWEQISHPELGCTITYPGCFVRSSEELCSIRRRAPVIGEHNLEVYEKELGLSREQVTMLQQDGVI